MTMFYAMLWLLSIHFVADFVFQSNWMAQNKSKSIVALGTHVIVYMAVLGAGALPVFDALNIADIRVYLAWVALNGALHLVTDYVTSRINSKLWEAKRVHGFFVGVGADQLIHAWTLGVTLDLLAY